MSQPSPFYDSPHEFEPLVPEKRRAELISRSSMTVRRSIGLASQCHPSTLETLRNLLREMNSYYSNRIEGQGTHPYDIERALRANYSGDADTARLQRLAVAHIDAERALEGVPTDEVLRFEFLQAAHRAVYERLSETDRRNGQGLIEPGRFRSGRVLVGRHVPPEAASIPAFAKRFDAAYGKSTSLDSALMLVAAAHHRASWVHPFDDGNGRAIRLQTQCALFPLSNGLWSVSRGLARQRDAYYAHLANADAPRAGDLDGRGFLSDAALGRWCEWFIDMCDDQIAFMTRLLNLDGIERRIRSLIAARSADDTRYRAETVAPLFHLFATGPCPRGTFLSMTGLGERTARDALAHLLRVGLVTSPDHRSPVRIAFPLDSLQLLFPDLYPEAASHYTAS
jgi:Fic family protein